MYLIPPPQLFLGLLMDKRTGSYFWERYIQKRSQCVIKQKKKYSSNTTYRDQFIYFNAIFTKLQTVNWINLIVNKSNNVYLRIKNLLKKTQFDIPYKLRMQLLFQIWSWESQKIINCNNWFINIKISILKIAMLFSTQICKTSCTELCSGLSWFAECCT